MFYKVLLLVVFSAALARAETDCNCDKYAEGDQELWKFLTELSDKYPNPDISSVLPGVLSPLLECNCLEKSRKKRKIFTEDKEVLKEAPEEVPKKVVERHVVNPARHYVDKHCPSGYVRIGIMCLPADYID